MPDPEAILLVVKEWIAKAENDLRTAAHTLSLGKDAPTDTICFHAQQCVEKYLKAFLVFCSIPFPKTHDLPGLLELLPAENRPKVDNDAQERMTEYATVTRYPGPGPDIGISEARQAVALARRLRKEIRRQLPRKVLLKRKK